MARKHLSLRVSDDEREKINKIAVAGDTTASEVVRQGIEMLGKQVGSSSKPDPRTFPLSSLSKSSVELYLKCPEKWRRRYLETEFEPMGPPLLIGKAAGNAAARNWHQKKESYVDLPASEVTEIYHDEFDLAVEGAEAPIDWRDQKKDDVRGAGARALAAYQGKVAPIVQPVSIEREFVLEFDEVDWVFKGYFDLEYVLSEEGRARIDAPAPNGDEPTIPGDLKMKAKMLSQDEADNDVQATSYLTARRAEGLPYNRFEFHVATTAKEPRAELVLTDRTDVQLDNFLRRTFQIAAEIGWRHENDHWQGAPPGSWWCSEKWCGFYNTCPYGGQR